MNFLLDLRLRTFRLVDMPVRATIDGEVWEFDTAAEAIEFKRQMATPVRSNPQAQPQPRQRRRQRQSRSGRAVAASVDERSSGEPMTANERLTAGSRAILEVLHRSPGLQSEDFARAIGVSGPMALPVRMMMLGKELKGLGLDPDEVILTEKKYVKGKKRSVYKPGPRLEDALRKNGNLFGVN